MIPAFVFFESGLLEKLSSEDQENILNGFSSTSVRCYILKNKDIFFAENSSKNSPQTIEELNEDLKKLLSLCQDRTQAARVFVFYLTNSSEFSVSDKVKEFLLQLKNAVNLNLDTEAFWFFKNDKNILDSIQVEKNFFAIFKTIWVIGESDENNFTVKLEQSLMFIFNYIKFRLDKAFETSNQNFDEILRNFPDNKGRLGSIGGKIFHFDREKAYRIIGKKLFEIKINSEKIIEEPLIERMEIFPIVNEFIENELSPLKENFDEAFKKKNLDIPHLEIANLSGIGTFELLEEAVQKKLNDFKQFEKQIYNILPQIKNEFVLEIKKKLDQKISETIKASKDKNNTNSGLQKCLAFLYSFLGFNSQKIFKGDYTVKSFSIENEIDKVLESLKGLADEASEIERREAKHQENLKSHLKKLRKKINLYNEEKRKEIIKELYGKATKDFENSNATLKKSYADYLESYNKRIEEQNRLSEFHRLMITLFVIATPLIISTALIAGKILKANFLTTILWSIFFLGFAGILFWLFVFFYEAVNFRNSLDEALRNEQQNLDNLRGVLDTIFDSFRKAFEKIIECYSYGIILNVFLSLIDYSEKLINDIKGFRENLKKLTNYSQDFEQLKASNNPYIVNLVDPQLINSLNNENLANKIFDVEWLNRAFEIYRKNKSLEKFESEIYQKIQENYREIESPFSGEFQISKLEEIKQTIKKIRNQPLLCSISPAFNIEKIYYVIAPQSLIPQNRANFFLRESLEDNALSNICLTSTTYPDKIAILVIGFIKNNNK